MKHGMKLQYCVVSRAFFHLSVPVSGSFLLPIFKGYFLVGLSPGVGPTIEDLRVLSAAADWMSRGWHLLQG